MNVCVSEMLNCVECNAVSKMMAVMPRDDDQQLQQAIRQTSSEQMKSIASVQHQSGEQVPVPSPTLERCKKGEAREQQERVYIALNY